MEVAARRKHAGVVAHEHVAVAKQRRQIGERTVFERPRVAPADEQPRRVAGVGRCLGDQLAGQVVVEIAEGETALELSHAVLRRRRSRRSCQASHLLAAQPQYGWR